MIELLDILLGNRSSVASDLIALVSSKLLSVAHLSKRPLRPYRNDAR
jgi:hypothetical protein